MKNKQINSINYYATYENELIVVKVYIKNIKNAYMKLSKAQFELTCNSQFFASAAMEKFVNQTIEKYYTKLKAQKEAKKKFPIDIENKFFYSLGNKYEFKIEDNKLYFKKENSDLFFYFGKVKKDIENQIKDYCFNEFNLLVKKYFEEVQEKFIKLLGLKSKNINYKIKNVKSFWGSAYNKKDLISLSSNLMYYNPICLYYILVHEFSHFLHQNHSKEFWNLVAQIVPNYKEIKRFLNTRNYEATDN
ncbi:DUF45 domain-containing protein [[Mycoplasma] falconis]|uniref:DUF45 domain-containing protein n=1 Tax=[Mycoplasma] falconis TaxID=92403 RepID=A0A501X9I7_9BACT|nr:M48 family metallopeptidase [[Mycoplasma] falconis]TPE57211.1 DUF45 domain-containing protein [[Mycoplasma] falconis]